MEANPEEMKSVAEHQEVPKRPWWRWPEHWWSSVGASI
jgi:hypothetical protein